MLTLGEAARLTGLGKTTITRAIKAGRLSATCRDDGAASGPRLSETVAPAEAAHRATPSETPATRDVAAWCATLDAELRGLRRASWARSGSPGTSFGERASRLEDQVLPTYARATRACRDAETVVVETTRAVA